MKDPMYAGVRAQDHPEDDSDDFAFRPSPVPIAPMFQFPTQLAFRPMTPTPWGDDAQNARRPLEKPAAPTLFGTHPAPAPDDEPVQSIENPLPDKQPVSRPAPRAYGPDGKWFPTFCCHDIKYSKHPHHHRLICGHDIVTNAIEVCGSNCALTRDAESKVANKAFACPVQDCKVRQGATLVKRKGVKPDRACTLSHVYGLDRAKDEARISEKESGPGVRNGSKTVRKRSESPPATMMAAMTTPQKKRQRIAVDADSEAAKLLNEPGVMELMQRTNTTHTRHLRNGRLETQMEGKVEGATTRAAAKLQNLGIAPSGGMPAFTEPRERKCYPSPDTHDAEYTEPVGSDTFCVCETTHKVFLVPCERCGKGFHPGCIGYGAFLIADYMAGTQGSDALFKADHDRLVEKGHSSAFHCPDCKTAIARALASLRGGIRSLRHFDRELPEDAVEGAVKKAFGDKIAKDVPRAARADPAPKGLKRKAEAMEVDGKATAEVEAGEDGEDVVMEDAPVARAIKGLRRRTKKKGAAR